MNNQHKLEYCGAVEADIRAELPLEVAHFAPGLARWVVYAIKPGSYLSAVLANDLDGVKRCGDVTSLQNLDGTLEAIRRVLPAACHGSAEAFHKWRGLDWRVIDGGRND